jgi:Flp pilus assembly protein TadD
MALLKTAAIVAIVALAAPQFTSGGDKGRGGGGGKGGGGGRSGGVSARSSGGGGSARGGGGSGRVSSAPRGISSSRGSGAAMGGGSSSRGSAAVSGGGSISAGGSKSSGGSRESLGSRDGVARSAAPRGLDRDSSARVRSSADVSGKSSGGSSVKSGSGGSEKISGGSKSKISSDVAGSKAARDSRRGESLSSANTASTSAKGAAKSASSSGFPRNVGDFEETHRVGRDTFLHDHDSDTFLHKHSSRKLHDHDTGEVFRVRSSGDLKHRGFSRNFFGHHGRHDGHHHDDDHFSFFLGVGSPWFGYGLYNPWWYDPWWYGAYPYGFYPGFGFSYHSRHFGIGIGVPFDYGYGWPYYAYEPICAYPPPVYGDAGGYAAAPGYAARIETEPPAAIAADGEPSIATDAAARGPALQATPPGKPGAGLSASTSDFARQGERAFKQRDYETAVKHWRHALLDEPKNGTLVMMLAQGLFAVGQYDEAAGATQAAMGMMPAEQWGVVVQNYTELYGNAQDYVDQWKALEKAVKEKPDDPAVRFLTGFHYGFMGYPADAVKQLDKLVELAPKDQMGKRLRDMMAERAKEKEPKPE